jgi:hypothetical protein
MSEQHMDDENDFTRKRQTYFLSAEFLITMIVQTGIFLVLGTTVINRVEARVAALESQQVTDARIARIEAKMETLIENQVEFRTAIKEVQTELRAARLAREK